MTGSPVSCRGRFAVVAILVLSVHGAAALAAEPWRTAQIGPPVKLAPLETVDQTAPALESPNTGASDTENEQAPESEPTSSNSEVEVNTLTAVDLDSVGLIDQSQGGFSVDLWRGTDRALVERLLPRLPSATRSKVARALLLRLLLSRATAPTGKSSSKSLLAIRVERVLAAGDIKSAVGLMRVAPSELTDEELARAEVEGLFFQNDNPGACAKVRRLIRHHKGRYWQQANAFCLALAGEHAKSAMIGDILREREADVGPAFFTLIDVLAGDKDLTVESLAAPNGLHLSMMRAANLRLPKDIVESGRPAILRAITLSPNADLELRLIAAEQAAMTGALQPSVLGELYGGVQFESEELANPVAAAAAVWGPRGRALLAQNLAGQDSATDKAEALRRAWTLSREKGGYSIVLRSSLPVLMSIEPAAELAWFARDAALGLFAEGLTERALAWYALAVAESGSSAEAKSAATALWPLAVLAGSGDANEWDAAPITEWWNDIRSKSAPTAVPKALMLYSALEALEKPVGPAGWAVLVGEDDATGRIAPDTALWHALQRASEAGRIGETVLLALLALGENGVGAVSPLTVRTVMIALRRVGLDVAARTLAIEAAMASDL